MCGSKLFTSRSAEPVKSTTAFQSVKMRYRHRTQKSVRPRAKIIRRKIIEDEKENRWRDRHSLRTQIGPGPPVKPMGSGDLADCEAPLSESHARELCRARHRPNVGSCSTTTPHRDDFVVTDEHARESSQQPTRETAMGGASRAVLSTAGPAPGRI